MEIDSFLDLVKRRRSIRRFKPDLVPDEYIEKILEAGRWAMSGANGQPWEFVVVKDKDKIAKLAEIHGEWRKTTYEIEMTRIEEIRQPAVLTFIPPPFQNVPVIIAIAGDFRAVQAAVEVAFVLECPVVFHQSLANAAMLMQLAAAALGLGSQWVSINEIHERVYRDVLGIPDIFRLEMLVPVGYPAFVPAATYRRDLNEIVHREQYDMARYRSDREVIDWIIQLRKRMKAHYPKFKQG